MSEASPDNIDLRAVFATITKKVPKLVIWALLAGSATYFGLALLAPRYQSEAELVVFAKGATEPAQLPSEGGGAESLTVRMDKEAADMHVRALRSPELGAAVAAEFKLAERREFNPQIGPVDTLGRLLRVVGIGKPRSGESEQDQVLKRYFERLEVYSPKEGRVIAIRFTSNDAALAAGIPNALAEAYRKSLSDRSVIATDEGQKAQARGVEEARIVSRARVASVPVFPRKGPFAALAAFATLLLGLAVTLTQTMLSGARGAGPSPQAASTSRMAAGERTNPVLPVANSAGAIPKGDGTLPSGNSDRYVDRSPPEPFEDSPQKRALTEEDVARVGSIGALARRITSRTETTGYRTLIAGETDLMGVSSHAIELAKALADLGHSVVLVDWSPEGDGVAHAVSMTDSPGIGDLLGGRATFEQIIRRIPDSDAHVIGAGTLDAAHATDPDRLNLILDALDEVYDQVVIAGRNEPARSFFETIGGRVDCGVLVADPGRVGSVLRDPPGSYLGFEVADIDLVRYDRQMSVVSKQRLLRAGRASATG